MAYLGVHFALTDKQYQKVLSAKSDSELISIIHEEIEAEWDKEWLHETGNFWLAIHRVLTDGELKQDNGSFPLSDVILGGKHLYQGADYIVTILSPQQVAEAATALKKIDQSAFEQGFENLVIEEYGEEEGLDDSWSTWAWFQGLPKLFDKAAQARRAILFSVDQ